MSMESVDDIISQFRQHIPEAAIVLTAVQGLLLYRIERPKIDYLIFLMTGVLTVEAVAIPLITGGKSLHEIVGLSPNAAIETTLKTYEKWGMIAGNGFLLFKYLYHRRMS